MTKPLAASQDIMKNYLSELLTDDLESLPEIIVNEPVKINLENQRLEQLLQNVETQDNLDTQIITSKKSSAVVETKEKITAKVITETDIPAVENILVTRKSQGDVTLTEIKDYRKGRFQAMFFDVAGLVIAVPLVELGGIHNVDKINNLMGKPPWFKGVMLHRDEQINVVDTALWVMPEKCDEALINSLNYQYVIMLSNSKWGLMAEHLVDTVTLEQDEVKWLDKPSKRPWLAGLVKERKCALLDIDALIQLLDDGSDIFQNN